MKRCRIGKNPCIICFQPVSKKNGIQCRGACKRWAHYICLNYTPGKIRDVRNRIIQVNCPCPLCDSKEPKEYLTDPPHQCNNEACPANNIVPCPQRLVPPPRIYQPSCPPTSCPISKPSPSTCGLIPRSRAVYCDPPPNLLIEDGSSNSSLRMCNFNNVCSQSQIQLENPSSYQNEHTRETASDSDMSGALLLLTLQEMCSTVGHLTAQLKDLMLKSLR